MVSKDELSETIIGVVRETLETKGLEHPPLDRNTPVDQSLGLDSLDWAAVVVRLEGETGVDPFAEGLGQQLRTLGDFMDLYAAALS